MSEIPSAPRRAVAAIAVVSFMAVYIGLAWYIGGHISYDSTILQLIYYPVAGILWVPGAYWIIKKIYKSC